MWVVVMFKLLVYSILLLYLELLVQLFRRCFPQQNLNCLTSLLLTSLLLLRWSLKFLVLFLVMMGVKGRSSSKSACLSLMTCWRAEKIAILSSNVLRSPW